MVSNHLRNFVTYVANKIKYRFRVPKDPLFRKNHDFSPRIQNLIKWNKWLIDKDINGN